jgi:zinc/manganese transport system ATP-binding protein
MDTGKHDRAAEPSSSPRFSAARAARTEHRRTAHLGCNRGSLALARDLVGLIVNSPAETAVVFRDLTLTYERHPAVHHLSGTLERGSLTAIVGPNGAGKSTLLKGIVGQMRPAEGMIERADLGRGGIAYLPQHTEIERRFPISVVDTVLLGHWRQIGWAGAATAAMREAAHEALAAVGLNGFERRPIETLSAGQFQRVLFARLIVQDAELILLDEPFASVDWRTSEDLLLLVEGWHRERRTVAAVLHDLDQVRAHFPDTLLIARECVAWGATLEVVTPDNLRQARRMSEAWSVEAEDCQRVPA